MGFKNCPFNQKCVTEEITWSMRRVSPSLIKQRYRGKLSGRKSKANKSSIVYAFLVMVFIRKWLCYWKVFFKSSSVDKHEFCNFEVFLSYLIFLFVCFISVYRLYPKTASPFVVSLYLSLKRLA